MRPTAAVLLLTTVLSQTDRPTTSPQPAFEVANVKPHDPNTTLPKGRILPAGLEIGGATVQDLLQFSYGILPYEIAGLPKWAHDTQFDIVAKAAHETPAATLRLMLRSLLAERFKLASHQEDKLMPAYVLTVGKNGAKLQPGSGTQQHCAWTELPGGVSRRECQNLSMAELARLLPGLGGIGIDLPVVDQTGLAGSWDFHLDVRLGPLSGSATGVPITGPGSGTTEGPTIFDAMERIGLRLDSRKVPLPVLVIDHIEPLIEN